MLPEKDILTSPLKDVTLTRFQGKTYAQETTLTTSTTRAVLLSNNPNRLFWIVINEGVSDVRVSTDPGITTASGWLVPAGGGVLSMFWEEDGESVGYTVYIIASANTPLVRVREVIRL